MDTELLRRLEHCARTPLMLVVADFDYSLSRPASRAGEASVHPASLRALRALAGIPWTRIAVICRRSVRELSKLLEPPGQELLVGSHGAEWMHQQVQLVPDQLDLLKRLEATIEAISHTSEGTWLERGPASVVLHYRQAAHGAMAHTVASLMAECAGRPGVFLRHGDGFLEVMVQRANRLGALGRLRQATSANSIVFLGDPRADQEVFACSETEGVALSTQCLDVTALPRNPLALETAAVLDALVLMRKRWIRSSSIEAHAE